MLASARDAETAVSSGCAIRGGGASVTAGHSAVWEVELVDASVLACAVDAQAAIGRPVALGARCAGITASSTKEVDICALVERAPVLAGP